MLIYRTINPTQDKLVQALYRLKNVVKTNSRKKFKRKNPYEVYTKHDEFNDTCVKRVVLLLYIGC